MVRTRAGRAILARMPGTFTLAHISDVHLAAMDRLRPADLLSKRALGYLSWRLRRRHKHRPDIVDALVRDLRAVAPDHVAVTGDLTTLGLPDEFAAGRRWLDALGSPATITVVPGNHDAYVREPWSRTMAAWAPYMASDGASPDTASAFPSVRRRGPVALVGLSSARPSPPGLAVGRVGADQLRRLDACLEREGDERRFRVLLVHHPPVAGAVSWRKRLTDAAALRAVLARRGVELVLHGHAHVTRLAHVATPAGPAPVVGAASASLAPGPGGRGARYNVYSIESRDGGWQVRGSVRAYLDDERGFAPESEPGLLTPEAGPVARVAR